MGWGGRENFFKKKEKTMPRDLRGAHAWMPITYLDN